MTSWPERNAKVTLRRIGCLIVLLWLVGLSEAWGWGIPGHRFVNKSAVLHLPPAMSQLTSAQLYLGDHASDADFRKAYDTAESPKHFLDLERYPDRHLLTPDLTALITQYGWTTVRENGILPWATLWALDSLTQQIRRGDWTKALSTAADLGHYVADAHQPLHCTVNYNGQLTGNAGVHSRYELTMISQNESALTITPDTVVYVADPWEFIIAYIVRSNALVDSVLQGDNAAKNASGWNGVDPAPSAYYNYLWQYTRSFTLRIFQEATEALASLWYTAWVNAAQSDTRIAERGVPAGWELEQNWPNPFNPVTQINYTIGQRADFGTMGGGDYGRSVLVQLTVYDILGREVKTLVNEHQAPGRYEVTFDGSGLASGVYVYQLSAAGFVQAKRCLLLR